MKNWKRCALIGIVAIIAVGFSFVGCDDGTKEIDLTGTIIITPATAYTGMELTATYSGNETVSYQWNKDGTAISGGTGQKLTPTQAGSYTVTVSLAGYSSKTSSAVAVTAIMDLSGTIIINPTPETTGRELTANYSGNEAVNYQWSKNETAIDGKTGVEFTPNEVGSYTVTVSATGYKNKTSEAVVVVIKTESVDIGNNKTMTVEFMALPSENTTDIIWWGTLMVVFDNLKDSFGWRDYVLTVVPGSSDGFAAKGSNKATVGEEFLCANADDYMTMGVDMNGMLDDWILMP